MTARQRAMLERKTDKDGTEQLLSLPTGIIFPINVVSKLPISSLVYRTIP